jgi:hypothetical protein
MRLSISSQGYWVLPGIYRVLAKIRVRVRVSDPPQSGIQVGYGFRPRSNVAVPGTYPDPLCTLLLSAVSKTRAGQRYVEWKNEVADHGPFIP